MVNVIKNWFANLSSLSRWIFFCLLVLIILLILQWTQMYGQFLSDDYDWVGTARTNIENGQWLKVFQTETGGNFYRPIVAFSFQIDYSLWHYSTFGYHLHQLLFHFILVLGVAWLVWQLFQSRSLAFATGLIFTVYPSQHEVIIWIAGRPDLYVTTFIVLSLALYVKFLCTHRWTWYALSFGGGILAMLSKESAFILPVFLLGALIIGVPFRPFKKFITQVVLWLPWLVILVGLLLIRSRLLTGAVAGYLVGGEQAGTHFTLANIAKPFTSIFNLVNWDYAFVRFGKQGVINFIYTIVQKLFVYWKFLAVVAAVVIIAYLIFSKIKQRKIYLVSALAWSLVAFIPVYGLSGAISQLQLSASRLFFLSSIGYAMVITFLFWPAATKSKCATVRRVLFVIVLIFLGLLWKLNAVPWHMASDQVAYIKATFKSQQHELLRDNPTHLFVRQLSGLVYGAYSFFGPHSIRESVYEITKNKNMQTYMVGVVPFVNSPLCQPNEQNKIAVITWDKDLKRFVEKDSAIIDKLKYSQTHQEPKIIWDFRDPATPADWSFDGLAVNQTEEGVIVNIPNDNKSFFGSPFFAPIFNGAYRFMDASFTILDNNQGFGERRFNFAWRSKTGDFTEANTLRYTYGPGNDINLRIPLCQYLNWSLFDNTEQIRVLPIRPGRVLIKSITFSAE